MLLTLMRVYEPRARGGKAMRSDFPKGGKSMKYPIHYLTTELYRCAQRLEVGFSNALYLNVDGCR